MPKLSRTVEIDNIDFKNDLYIDIMKLIITNQVIFNFILYILQK